MITAPFPDTAAAALTWLNEGGDPDSWVVVRHTTANAPLKPNPWWLEAFWRLYQENGGEPDVVEAWSEVVVQALERSVRPNAVDRDHEDPVARLFAYGFPYDRKVWTAWLGHPGADLNALNPQGEGVLHALVTDRQTRGTMPLPDLLELMGAHGLNVNAQDRHGQGALHWLANLASMTAESLAPMIATWLGEQGLDGEREDLQGWSGRERLAQTGRRTTLLAYEEGWSRWERRVLSALPDETQGDQARSPRTLRRL